MTHQNDVLSALGFRSVQGFQAAYNLGSPLMVDGIWGPLTEAAGVNSLQRHNSGQPDISAHFSAREFACRCGGTLPGCEKTKVLRSLVQSLEVYRTIVGPLLIVSGYRCPQHNARVGGASNSQHLYGAAADVPAARSVASVAHLRQFAGIGYQHSTGLVVHVDRRDVSGHNTTGGSQSDPTEWVYN